MSLTEKLKTEHVAGMVQEWFRAGDKTYVASTPDPNSNYKPVVDNTLGEITDPTERLTAELAYDVLYRH